MTHKIKTILLVDDDHDDQLLFQEALSEADNSILFQSACNGVDALEKLNFAENDMPDLIFMDVNMPKMNGIDCLIEIKKSEKLKMLPVMMYSTSSFSQYQKECFDHGAIDYIVKPDDYGRLCDTLKNIINSEIPISSKKPIAL